MPAARRSDRAREVAIEMRPLRARDVSLGIGLITPVGARQLVAAIENSEARAGRGPRHERGELGDLDQSGVGGSAHVGSRSTRRGSHPEQTFSVRRLAATIPRIMAIDLYWGSGSPYSWRVLLALEHKRLAYTSHLLQLSM